MPDSRMPRSEVYYWIYVAIFGVLWGGGASILAGTLPPEPITRVVVITWYEATVIALTKVVLLRRFSVTHASIVASSISVFTFSFGPPSPYKIMFILAGLAFDAGTGFRTVTLKRQNLVLAFVAFVTVAYPLFALNLYLIDPSILPGVTKLIYIAAGVYVVLGTIISFVIWRYINPDHRPQFVESIQKRIASDPRE